MAEANEEGECRFEVDKVDAENLNNLDNWSCNCRVEMQYFVDK